MFRHFCRFRKAGQGATTALRPGITQAIGMMPNDPQELTHALREMVPPISPRVQPIQAPSAASIGKDRYQSAHRISYYLRASATAAGHHRSVIGLWRYVDRIHAVLLAIGERANRTLVENPLVPVSSPRAPVPV